MANVIYRGPITAQPITVNLPVAGAYLPGILVTSSGATLTVATASDVEAQLYVLNNLDFAGQGLDVAYVSGDTGAAYEIAANQSYQVRLATATYAADDLLTIGASGYLTKATAGDVVHARFKGTAGAVTAGALVDVQIANSFVKAV